MCFSVFAFSNIDFISIMHYCFYEFHLCVENQLLILAYCVPVNVCVYYMIEIFYILLPMFV